MWLGERDLMDAEGAVFLKLRDTIAANGWTRCHRRGTYWIKDIQHIPDDNNIYRVNIDATSGHVKIACIGIESVDSVIDGTYSSVSMLPDWIREKLTLLAMLSPKPPTEPLAGVGRRITADTYWVFC